MRRDTLIARAALLAAVVLCAANAHGECIRTWKSAAEYLRGPTWIFVGTVIQSMDDDGATRFAVDRFWQGQLEPNTTLLFEPGMEVWNPWNFKPGVTYLVFATPTRSHIASGQRAFTVDICGPTGESSSAETAAYLKQLGPPGVRGYAYHGMPNALVGQSGFAARRGRFGRWHFEVMIGE